MGKLVRREGRRMLRLKRERVLVVEMMVGSESVGIEAMEVGRRRGLSSMHAAFGGG